MSSAIARTLPAMTAVQAMVAMGVFALSVLAPQLGVDVQSLGILGSVMFGIGALSSVTAGWLIRRLGDLQLAGLCMAAVTLAMTCLSVEALGVGPARWSSWPAVLLLGFAFGPETPASASVLARVTPLARRPWIFSVRQTGNQIGAIAGSLLLPLLLVQHAAWPFALVAVLALAVGLWCIGLVRSDGGAPTLAATSDGSGLAELVASPALRLLTFTMVVYMATQVSLNFFSMSHAVHHWQLPVPAAAGWLALMQGAGLVGRLLWGRVAQRPGMPTLHLLGGLGLAMGAAGLLLFLWPGTPPPAALGVLFMLVGLSASGWNGVMIAELARIAGPARAGAVTGAALLFSYTGIAIAPLTFAALGKAFGTPIAFAALLTATSIMGLLLLRRPLHPPNPLQRPPR
ncbi:MFS transporter [Variovorax ginsengisoli]|uniref:MFS family permease n=1 Tax=Variovorax ginsengisoli TaxID=363844 RepID=A0ABT9S0U4_9BURK|nr:MFS transporter [Variovorax ginsengisoli]MDP9897975.1 MFS family permease [Variovorax ginsengisoli]